MGELVQIANKRAAADEEKAKAARRARWAGLRPSTVQVYVENRCNLRCAHCYETDATHPGHAQLSLAEYDRIFGELAQLGALFMTLTGGEIFMRRDLLDIVALARQHRFHVTLYTSGYHLDDAKADRLAQLKVGSVHVSLYSHDPAVHDGFTNIPGSHARSVSALRRLKARGIHAVMKANLMTFNVEHIDEMMALARDIGVDYQFDPTVKPRMDGDRSPLQYAVPPETLRKLVLNRPDLYMAFKQLHPGDVCTGQDSLFHDDEVLCGAGRNTLSINADGTVAACGFFPTTAGSLKTQSLDEIWYTSAHLDAVRGTRFGDMEACAICDVRTSCSPCMAYADVEHGDHRQCATSSRQMAEAVRALAEKRVHSEKKQARGVPLPLVGDLAIPRPILSGRVPRLSSE